MSMTQTKDAGFWRTAKVREVGRMKTVTLKFLKTIRACTGGAEWFADRYTEAPLDEVLDALIADGKGDWARWLLPRCLSAKGAAELAVWCAEDVLPIFEKEFPGDKRSRAAIAAAQKAIENPTEENRSAARAAAWAADAAARAAAADAAHAAEAAEAWATWTAAVAAARAADAADAADAAARAAADAAWAADAAARAAADAAWAARAARAADETFMRRFVARGLEILAEEGK